MIKIDNAEEREIARIALEKIKASRRICYGVIDAVGLCEWCHMPGKIDTRCMREIEIKERVTE